MIGPGFAGVVGGAGAIGGVLGEDLVRIERQIAVDLAGTDVVEPPDADLAGRLQERLGPEHVGAEEQPGVENGQAVVGLGRKVDDRVDLLLPQRLLSQGTVADVTVHEDDRIFDIGQIRPVAGIREHVIGDDVVLRMLFDPVADEIRPDKTGSSRHEKAHKGESVAAIFRLLGLGPDRRSARSHGRKRPSTGKSVPQPGRRWTTSPAETVDCPLAVCTTR